MGTERVISETPSSIAAEQYRYDAFISYRHVEPDRKWAKWLHSALETYRVPRKLVQQGMAPRIGRVFRDEEELSAAADLHKDIEAKLRESRYLIVICSPRTPGSKWVNAEVQLFREMGRHDQIFALLIEGEPVDSFPPALREIRRTITDEQGPHEQIEEVEPLAADVRPSRSEKRGHIRRMAKLRLLACLLGCRFDDLRQREQERKLRRVEFAGALVTVLLGVMMGLAWFAFIQRKAAIVSQRQAVASAERAIKGEREAEMRLAEGQTAQADALGLAGGWAEARSIYWESYASLKRLGLSTFNTEAGLCGATAAAPPPLRSFGNGLGGVSQLVVNLDGRTAVSAHDAYRINDSGFRRWDLITGREIGSVRVSASYHSTVSPDGRFGLSENPDHTVTLRNLLNGTVVQTLVGHQQDVNGIAFSPDGLTAVSSSRDGILMFWHLTGSSPTRMAQNIAGVRDLAFAADGDAVYMIGATNAFTSLSRWDLKTGELSGIPLPVYSRRLALESRGATALVAVSDPSSILHLDLATGKLIRTIIRPNQISSMAFSTPDGRRCLTGDTSGSAVRYLDLETGTELATLSGHQGEVGSVTFMPGTRTALSGGGDGTVNLWSLRGGKDVRILAGHSQGVVTVAISPDGRTVLSGSDDQTFKLWDVASGKELRTFFGHTDHVHSVVFSPDGRAAFSGSFDGTIRQWELASGQEMRTLASNQAHVWGIAVSPDGSHLVTASSGLPAKILDLNSGTEIIAGAPGPHADQGNRTVAIAPDGTTALLAGGPTMRLWNIKEGKLLREFDNTSGVCVAFTPDSGTVVLSGAPIRQWDVKSGAEIRSLRGSGTLNGVAVSPNGRFVVAGSGDKTIKLFDRESGKEIRSLAGHTGSVWSVAFSPDGKTIVSGSEDKTVRIWDIGRVAKYPEFERRLAEAEAKLKEHPDDPSSLATIGEWYAFRGVHEWAVELLERARTGGAAVSPLMLARSYWELCGDLPEGSKLTRGECLTAARREFGKALEASKDEAERFYLNLCIGAVEREAASPRTQPSTAPSTRPAE